MPSSDLRASTEVRMSAGWLHGRVGEMEGGAGCVYWLLGIGLGSSAHLNPNPQGEEEREPIAGIRSMLESSIVLPPVFDAPLYHAFTGHSQQWRHRWTGLWGLDGPSIRDIVAD